jgi:hypothetical protein
MSQQQINELKKLPTWIVVGVALLLGALPAALF